MGKNNNEYITIGEVMGTQGQNGALRVMVLTEFPERFKRGARFYIEGKLYTITTVRLSKETAIMQIEGIDTAEAAEQLRGKHLEIPLSERKTLPAGRYYHYEVIGLEVFTNTGVLLGRVSEILSTGSNDVYVVKDDGRETLIPAVKDIVKKIDLAQKRITIEVIEGLLN